MSFKDKAIKYLDKLVDDITTLQVTTISGEVTIDSITIVTGNDKKIDFKKILEMIGGAGAATAKIKLIASTLVDFDNDVVQYYGSSLSEEEKSMLSLHTEAVKNASEARKAAVESFLSIIK